MPTHLFSSETTEPDIISIGSTDDRVSFDVSFIPADKGYEIYRLIANRKSDADNDSVISPDYMARVICIAARGQIPDSITPEWVASHLDYKKLQEAFLYIIKRIMPGRAEKNE